MTLESIEKLRELAMDMNSTEIISHTRLTPPYLLDGDWLDSWHRAFDKACDDIEREIAERYMELPVDAEGVPIHVGDEMESDNERFVVCAVALGRVHRWHVHNIGELDKGTVAYPPGSLHHYKPRTIEDVLEEFAHEWNDTHHDDMPALKAKYADELRSKGVGE